MGVNLLLYLFWPLRMSSGLSLSLFVCSCMHVIFIPLVVCNSKVEHLLLSKMSFVL